jgi:hypothetical protein
MSLVVPQCVLQTINKFERSFFWARMDKVLGGQCKVNWKIVCKPKERGGLGIIDLDKFARALRLRWPWLIWKDPSKAFIGADHPCDDAYMDFFYAATTLGGRTSPSIMGSTLTFGLIRSTPQRASRLTTSPSS